MVARCHASSILHPQFTNNKLADASTSQFPNMVSTITHCQDSPGQTKPFNNLELLPPQYQPGYSPNEKLFQDIQTASPDIVLKQITIEN